MSHAFFFLKSKNILQTLVCGYKFFSVSWSDEGVIDWTSYLFRFFGVENCFTFCILLYYFCMYSEESFGRPNRAKEILFKVPPKHFKWNLSVMSKTKESEFNWKLTADWGGHFPCFLRCSPSEYMTASPAKPPHSAWGVSYSLACLHPLDYFINTIWIFPAFSLGRKEINWFNSLKNLRKKKWRQQETETVGCSQRWEHTLTRLVRTS